MWSLYSQKIKSLLSFSVLTLKCLTNNEKNILKNISFHENAAAVLAQ